MAAAMMPTPAECWYDETARLFLDCEGLAVAVVESVLLPLSLPLSLPLFVLTSLVRVNVGVAALLAAGVLLATLVLVPLTDADGEVEFVPRGGGVSTRD